MLGHTDEELAKYFEISQSTLNEWKLKYDDFSEAIKKGKDDADADVSISLYKRATGYNAPDTDIRVIQDQIVITPIIKHYPPDPVSMIFWLKNRQKGKWRDKHVQEHEGLPNMPTPQVNVYNTGPELSASEDEVEAKEKNGSDPV